MGLYRKARPGELSPALVAAALVAADELYQFTEFPANKSPKRGRPIVSTGDPARDKRNAQQRELMRKHRAAKAK